MAASESQKGYLVAYSHKQAAKDAVELINEKYPLEIQLKHFEGNYKIKKEPDTDLGTITCPICRPLARR